MDVQWDTLALLITLSYRVWWNFIRYDEFAKRIKRIGIHDDLKSVLSSNAWKSFQVNEVTSWWMSFLKLNSQLQSILSSEKLITWCILRIKVEWIVWKDCESSLLKWDSNDNLRRDEGQSSSEFSCAACVLYAVTLWLRFLLDCVDTFWEYVCRWSISVVDILSESFMEYK